MKKDCYFRYYCFLYGLIKKNYYLNVAKIELLNLDFVIKIILKTMIKIRISINFIKSLITVIKFGRYQKLCSIFLTNFNYYYYNFGLLKDEYYFNYFLKIIKNAFEFSLFVFFDYSKLLLKVLIMSLKNFIIVILYIFVIFSYIFYHLVFLWLAISRSGLIGF